MNVSNKTYGLTVLCPIKPAAGAVPSPEQELRKLLDTLPRGTASPFASVGKTHMARLTILNTAYFEGYPSKQDYLQSPYLLFNSNFDGDLDSYLDQLFDEIPGKIDEIWNHCVGFPGTSAGNAAWRAYIKKCQVNTTFFFAAVNDMSVDDMLRALMLQRMFTEFATKNQGKSNKLIQKNFLNLMKTYYAAETPPRGSVTY